MNTLIDVGKSHTVSTILENCLLEYEPHTKASPPLKPIIFHYDQAPSNLCEVLLLLQLMQR